VPEENSFALYKKKIFFLHRRKIPACTPSQEEDLRLVQEDDFLLVHVQAEDPLLVQEEEDLLLVQEGAPLLVQDGDPLLVFSSHVHLHLHGK